MLEWEGNRVDRASKASKNTRKKTKKPERVPAVSNRLEQQAQLAADKGHPGGALRDELGHLAHELLLHSLHRHWTCVGAYCMWVVFVGTGVDKSCSQMAG
jgi:hypothetical protein